MKPTVTFPAALCAALLSLAACRPSADSTAEPAPDLTAVAAPISLDEAHPVTDIDRMMNEIAELSSDAYGGREPMSEGEALTLAFIESRFRDLGLQPLFGDSYRQPVDLVSIEAVPETVQMTFHLPDRDRRVAYPDEMVAFTMRAVPESRVQGSRSP